MRHRKSEPGGPGPAIRTTPGPMRLLNGEVGTIRLKNAGNSPLEISEATLEGEHAGDFRIISESFSGVLLYPGTECELDIRFTTGEGGVRKAWLRMASNAAPGDHRISLVGYAPTVEVIGDCEDSSVRATLPISLPVAFRASGTVGGPVITCGERRLVQRGSTLLLAQEFHIEIPVHVVASATCGENDVEPVTFQYKICHTAVAELPLRTGIQPGECEVSDGCSVAIAEDALTAVQTLHLELPLEFGARVECDPVT